MFTKEEVESLRSFVRANYEKLMKLKEEEEEEEKSSRRDGEFPHFLLSAFRPNDADEDWTLERALSKRHHVLFIEGN